MPKPSKNSFAHIRLFIDYKPAELRCGKEWIIVYYAKHPISGDLERFRLRVPAHPSVTERRKLAKKIVLELNKKLENGWSPHLEESGKTFRTFADAKTSFLKQTAREVADDVKRIDTLRSYTSYLTLLEAYIAAQERPITFVAQMSKSFVVNYLDHIYNSKGNSPISFNNTLNFLGNFFNYLIARGYLIENPTAGIVRKKKKAKIRQVMPPHIKVKVAEAAKQLNYHYYAMCMVTYYSFIRGTELTKLRVSDVRLDHDYIQIRDTVSKNKKSESVTIPVPLRSILQRHLAESAPNDYLFSANDFKPGTVQLKYKKIPDTWVKIRKLAGIGLEYQFYSLKDTGITDLLNSGVPAIKVRDQARHHDLKITESYTSRNRGSDDTIKNANYYF